MSSFGPPIFVGGCRSAFCRAFKGSLLERRPDDLLVDVLTAQAERNPFWGQQNPEDVILGCAYPEGEQGYNLARTVALGAGRNVPGCTVNRLCASSLEAVAMAAGRIKAGWGHCYLVGGVESMSRIPRRGSSFSPSARIENRCPAAYIPNGETAELVAQRYGHITRAAQEEFAARSHELADAAYRDHKYSGQIVPVSGERDEFIRVPVDREKMASLKPAFRDNGVVTAATSSPLTDGAAIGWVVERDVAMESGATSGLEVIDAVVAAVDPEVMGLGPIPATVRLLERNGLTAEDIAACEINEAFAIQVLACVEELELPMDRVNTWGGAIAIGHPLGASGLRLVMTLHDRLAERAEDQALGLVTLCVGGGQGMSVLFRLVTF